MCALLLWAFFSDPVQAEPVTVRDAFGRSVTLPAPPPHHDMPPPMGTLNVTRNSARVGLTSCTPFRGESPTTLGADVLAAAGVLD